MLRDKLLTNGNYLHCVDRIKDELQLGKITTARANVELVIAARVRVIENSLPRDVRKALNDAVKNGELGHMKEDGLKPEVYYFNRSHFKSLANQVRKEIEENSIKAISKVCGVTLNDF